MILNDPDQKKDLDKIPDMGENGDPIYKIDHQPDDGPPAEESADRAEESEFQDTPQDLKNETSQE